jgi:murein DD-endopeptidase MepM/ murein hydrolase activator NlpD
MSKTPKPQQTIYSDKELTKFLDETTFESHTNPAWDLERSTPMGTLKDMIRKYHTPTEDNKLVLLAQILRTEEGKQSLYQTRNPDDTSNNVQLVRFRVVGDRRHYWLPEPKGNLDDKNNAIISMHPLAKYELPEGESATPLKAGDMVEVQFDNVNNIYSSYFEVASIIKRVGNLDSIGGLIKNRCSDIVLPNLPTDSTAENIINDPCLVVGNLTNFNMANIQQQAAANKQKIVFPRFPVSTGERLTSEFGKVRNYTDDEGRPIRRVHFGTDYDLAKNNPVLAALDGQCIKSQYNAGGYGHYIVLKHTKYSLVPGKPPTVFFTLYAHLGTDDPAETNANQPRRLSVGKFVERGSLLGLGGNSGLSISANGGDGSHLHFEYIIPLDGQTAFPGFGRQVLRKTRKDPVTEFFRRGFFQDTPEAAQAARRERRNDAVGDAYGGG